MPSVFELLMEFDIANVGKATFLLPPVAPPTGNDVDDEGTTKQYPLQISSISSFASVHELASRRSPAENKCRPGIRGRSLNTLRASSRFL